jgi:hypothetical protein
VFQEGPERLLLVRQLLAGAHRLAPWRLLALLAAQLHHPLQRLLKGQPDRVTRSLQGQPVRGSSLPLVPVRKQLLLQLQQLGSELGAGAGAFVDGGQITLELGPAQLALMGGQVVVGREAIAHHRAGKAIAQQVDRRCSRAAQALPEHGHHRRHQPLRGRLRLHPQPAATARWVVAHRCAQDFVYGIAGGGAGFIHGGHRLLADRLQCFNRCSRCSNTVSVIGGISST